MHTDYIHSISNEIKDKEITLAFISARINHTKVLINKKIELIDSYNPILFSDKKKAQAELETLRSSITTDSNYCKQLNASIEKYARQLLTYLELQFNN